MKLFRASSKGVFPLLGNSLSCRLEGWLKFVDRLVRGTPRAVQQSSGTTRFTPEWLEWRIDKISS